MIVGMPMSKRNTTKPPGAPGASRVHLVADTDQAVELPIQDRRRGEGASSRVWFRIRPRRMLMRGAAEVVVRRARCVVELVMGLLPVWLRNSR